MVRILRLPTGLAATALLCVPLAAQPAKPLSWILRHGKHAAGNSQPTPFPMGQSAPPISTDVQFRSPGEMSPADRALAANSHSAIASRAALDALGYDRGQWTEQQIVCRALPNHLFLRFTRDDGIRDRSVFTVSIPRERSGRMRLIPVLRRGYSLFTPAGINAGTIAAFNQIRREDGPSNAGWLETGLCYAALAGADPRVGALTGDEMLSEPAPPLAQMVVPVDGGAVITFTDQASQPHPTLWTLTFDRTGSLVKVKHQPAVEAKRYVAPASQDAKGAPLPPTEIAPQPH
jgi:hypothetical protein